MFSGISWNLEKKMDTDLNVFSSAYRQYNSNPIERSLLYLQTQLDVLINKTNRGSSLSIFSPSEILPSECLTILVDIIGDPNSKPSLILKCILLLSNLVVESDIRHCLHEDFQLTPALAKLVIHHGAAEDTLTEEALNLLQKVTYGHRLDFQETYVEDLICCLMKHVYNQPKSLTVPCMGILVNLCRDNFAVQSFIKNTEDMKKLTRALVNFLVDGNFTLITLSLSLLACICIHYEETEKLFSVQNINKTFQTVFNYVISGDTICRLYSVDLFKDLLKITRFQEPFLRYDYLSTSIEKVLMLLSTCTAESVTKIFELLITFCSVPGIRPVVCRSVMVAFPIQDAAIFPKLSQTPLSKISDPLLATVHWAGQPTDISSMAPIMAFDFLTEIYEELVFSNTRVQYGKHAALLIPAVVSTLNVSFDGESATLRKKCAKIVEAIKLLIVLCGEDELKDHMIMHIESATLYRLLEFQFTSNAVIRKSKYIIQKEDWCETGVDVVLYTVELMSKLAKRNGTLDELYSATLQDTRLVSFLVLGLTSGVRERVQVTLNIVSIGTSLDGFPLVLLGDAVASCNAKKEKQQMDLVPVTSLHQAASKRMPLGNKENLPQFNNSANYSETSATSNYRQDSDADIQSLIEKLNSGIDMKSDVAAIYERTLQAVQTREEHLQDMLEAKTLALNQADRLLSQYRSRKGQENAEASRLRGILFEAEKRLESLQQQLQDVTTQKEGLMQELEEADQENRKLKQIAQLHKQLTTAHSELAEKHEVLKKSHMSLSQEHKTLNEIHEMLKKHNESLKEQHDMATEQLLRLQEEQKKLTKQLREKETKLADTIKNLEKVEKEYKKVDEDRENLEAAIEKFRLDLDKTEKKKKELQHQVTSLELLCSQQEGRLNEAAEESVKLKEEVNKHRQIAALINSLSSGNVSETSMKHDQK
ncbi:hypothetical protein ACJMK2_027878 [Sinanodonta woodiana]|uniref:CIP2A N-terminal domain-containing protein n=1 Tax=Sinanodonta woodiana TaxID=1069815 RepID=A0ABD3X5A1_SINWO